jgi:hypothetical protein
VKLAPKYITFIKFKNKMSITRVKHTRNELHETVAGSLACILSALPLVAGDLENRFLFASKRDHLLLDEVLLLCGELLGAC